MSMEPYLAIVVIIVGIIALYQFGCRCISEEEKLKLEEDVEQLLNAIEESKRTGRLRCMTPKSTLINALYKELLRLFLEKKDLENSIGHKTIHRS